MTLATARTFGCPPWRSKISPPGRRLRRRTAASSWRARRRSRCSHGPLFAASAEQTRYYLCGVQLHDVDDGLVAVATDDHRLACVTIPGAAGLSADHRVIVPTIAVKLITRLLTERRCNCGHTRAGTSLASAPVLRAAPAGSSPGRRPAGGNRAILDRRCRRRCAWDSGRHPRTSR